MVCWQEYLLGVLHGDGSILFNRSKNGRTPSGITIPVSPKDEPYADRMIEIVSLAYPNTKPRKKYSNSSNMYRVNFFNAEIARNLYRFKQNGKWHVPELSHPEFYLAGLWDTDGYVGKTRRLALELSVKSSSNLFQVENIMKELGFSSVKIRVKKYSNKLGSFSSDRIVLQSKQNALMFKELIPLQHYRKQMEMDAKIADFENVKGRRRHGGLRDEVVKLTRCSPMSGSELAALLGKKDATHLTKELLKYTKEGFLSRERIGGVYVYSSR
jgi:hypothetical protein